VGCWILLAAIDLVRPFGNGALDPAAVVDLP